MGATLMVGHPTVNRAGMAGIPRRSMVFAAIALGNRRAIPHVVETARGVAKGDSDSCVTKVRPCAFFLPKCHGFAT